MPRQPASPTCKRRYRSRRRSGSATCSSCRAGAARSRDQDRRRGRYRDSDATHARQFAERARSRRSHACQCREHAGDPATSPTSRASTTCSGPFSRTIVSRAPGSAERRIARRQCRDRSVVDRMFPVGKFVGVEDLVDGLGKVRRCLVEESRISGSIRRRVSPRPQAQASAAGL